MGSRIKNEIIKKKPLFSEDKDVNNYSINMCLVELGAPPDEVYYTKQAVDKRGHYYNSQQTKKTKIYHVNRTIYERYTKDELWYWATSLYNAKIRDCHPDKHMTSKVFWNEYTKYINQVYDRVQKILKRGKYARFYYHRGT